MTDNIGLWGSWNALWMREPSVDWMESLLRTPEIQQLIHSDQQYDALFLSSPAISEVFAGLKHKFKPIASFELVPISSFHYAHFLYGSPVDTSQNADTFLFYGYKMNFFERMHSALFTWTTNAVWTLYYMPKYEALLDKYMRYDGWQTRPPLMELLSDVSFVFVNHHPASNYPMQMSPHFIQSGGVHLRPPEKLPQDLQEFLDEAEEGVIYFSLGSMSVAGATLGDLKQEFTDAFRRLKQRVIWKMDAVIPDLPPNVMTSSWLPQQSLLGHEKMKLFINQAGSLSILEALRHGVPILCIPLWSDQFTNAIHVEEQGYGAQLRADNITSDVIVEVVHQLVHNTKYKEEAMRRMRMIRDSKETPLERVAYWVEYALRHRGAHHLRPAVASMPWYIIMKLDIIAGVFFLLLISLLLMYLMVLNSVKIALKALCFIKKIILRTKKTKMH